jgi:hypothetical protein
MRYTDLPAHLRGAVREEDSSLFVALELSKSVWLVAASAPGSEKASIISIVLRLPMSLRCWPCWRD